MRILLSSANYDFEDGELLLLFVAPVGSPSDILAGASAAVSISAVPQAVTPAKIANGVVEIGEVSGAQAFTAFGSVTVRRKADSEALYVSHFSIESLHLNENDINLGFKKVVLEPLRLVTVRVLDENDRPVPNAPININVEGMHDEILERSTDESGTVHILMQSDRCHISLSDRPKMTIRFSGEESEKVVVSRK